MAKLKVVIGTDHVGTRYAGELIDAFPDIEFVVAYDTADHVEAIRDADAFFGWPNGEAFAAAEKLRWIACPGMGIDKIVAYQNIVDSDVPITNAPGTHVTSMGDHVIGAMVGLTHRFQEAFEDRQKKVWDTEKYASRITEITGTTDWQLPELPDRPFGARHHAEWLEIVRGVKPDEASGWDSLAGMHVIQAIYEAAESGGRVSVPYVEKADYDRN